MTLEMLKTESLKLDRIERIEFIQFVLESLAREEKEQAADYGLSEEQKEIALSRVEEIKNGKVETKLSQMVEEKLNKKYGFDA